MRFSKQLLIAAVAAFAPVLTHAASMTSSPTLSVSGLTFNDFTCTISKGGVIATPSSCNQINVSTITSPSTGIQISSGFTAALGSFDDAVLTYDLSSTKGITNVGLDFNGTFFGLGISSVTETVYSGSKQVGFAQVYCGVVGGCTRTDDIALNGVYSNLHIVKDINVTAALGVAQASVIDQTFTTTTPEPASMTLLGIGLLGAGILKRKKKATV